MSSSDRSLIKQDLREHLVPFKFYKKIQVAHASGGEKRVIPTYIRYIDGPDINEGCEGNCYVREQVIYDIMKKKPGQL